MAILTQTRARPGWWTILTNFWAKLDRDHVSIMAAGVAFYALLSIFPGMSTLISLYGLVADPAAIEQLLSSLAGVLPQEALKLLSDQLHALVAAPHDKLGLGLLVSLLIALWSATSGTGALMQALTVVYEEREERGILTYYGLAIALTIGIGLFALLSLFLIAVVPAILGTLPIPQDWQDRLSWIRWPLLAVLAVLALGLLYRFAPSRREPCWHCFSVGTIVAALLWLLGSAGFSFYVARFSSYDKTYGSLGAVVILLMWFYVTAYIVLAGAELNSEIEKAQARH
jgi:membrane protein